MMTSILNFLFVMDKYNVAIYADDNNKVKNFHLHNFVFCRNIKIQESYPALKQVTDSCFELHILLQFHHIIITSLHE